MQYLQNSTQSRHVAYSAALRALDDGQLMGLSEDFSLASQSSPAELSSAILAALDAQGEPCIKVEYDASFTGGAYEGCGELSYIPISLIDASAAEMGSYEDGILTAFRTHTHFDPVHVVHYEQDEVFTSTGKKFVGSEMLDQFGMGVTAQMLSEKYGHEGDGSNTTLLTVTNPDADTKEGETEEMDLRICGFAQDAYFEWITEYGDPIGDVFYSLDEAMSDGFDAEKPDSLSPKFLE